MHIVLVSEVVVILICKNLKKKKSQHKNIAVQKNLLIVVWKSDLGSKYGPPLTNYKTWRKRPSWSFIFSFVLTGYQIEILIKNLENSTYS